MINNGDDIGLQAPFNTMYPHTIVAATVRTAGNVTFTFDDTTTTRALL